jgi:hypothetical protein
MDTIGHADNYWYQSIGKNFLIFTKGINHQSENIFLLMVLKHLIKIFFSYDHRFFSVNRLLVSIPAIFFLCWCPPMLDKQMVGQTVSQTLGQQRVKQTARQAESQADNRPGR